jgi:hypothetical protein
MNILDELSISVVFLSFISNFLLTLVVLLIVSDCVLQDFIVFKLCILLLLIQGLHPSQKLHPCLLLG